MGYFKTSTVDKWIQIYNVQNIEEDIKVKFLFCFVLNNMFATPAFAEAWVADRNRAGFLLL